MQHTVEALAAIELDLDSNYDAPARDYTDALFQFSKTLTEIGNGLPHDASVDHFDDLVYALQRDLEELSCKAEKLSGKCEAAIKEVAA